MVSVFRWMASNTYDVFMLASRWVQVDPDRFNPPGPRAQRRVDILKYFFHLSKEEKNPLLVLPHRHGYTIKCTYTWLSQKIRRHAPMQDYFGPFLADFLFTEDHTKYIGKNGSDCMLFFTWLINVLIRGYHKQKC